MQLLQAQPEAQRARLEHALEILEAGLQAVDPAQAVRTALRLDAEGCLHVAGATYDLSSFQHVWLVGAGKAAAPMAEAVVELLRPRLRGGALTVKYGHTGAQPLPGIVVTEAGHPCPDRAGLEGTRAILRVLEQAGPLDLVIAVVSGGASALLEWPVEGVSLAELQELTGLLLRAGADIDSVNVVRKHLSRVKGGQLAQLAAPARLLGLVLSDVVGSPLSSIASGPTVADPSTHADALEVLRHRGLTERVPESIRRHLRAGCEGRVAETPKPGAKLFEGVQNVVVADNAIAAGAAAARAASLGYHAAVLSTFLEGEAREVARVLASVAREVRAHGRPVALPAALIAGGETTVTVSGPGKGGRNQELALAAALALEGVKDVLLVTLATDGSDGPTEAAGAVVSGDSVRRARALGLDPRGALEANDAYPFFDRLGALLVTGPTRTNVCDLNLVLIG